MLYVSQTLCAVSEPFVLCYVYILSCTYIEVRCLVATIFYICIGTDARNGGGNGLSTKEIVVIIVVIISGGVIVVLPIIIYYCIRKRTKKGT